MTIVSPSQRAYCRQITAIVALLFLALPVAAQQIETPSQALPVASPPASQQQTTGDQTAKQPGQSQDQSKTDDEKKEKPDRIFGVLPNYTTVNGTAQLRPITWKEKFKITAQGAFDPYEFGIVAILAAKSQAEDNDAAWGQGMKGYGKRYAAGFADQAIGNFMTGAIYPSLLHQDPRYFRMGQGGIWHRTAYAVTRVIITRGDSGAKQFDFSEFLGDASAAGIADVYHTRQDRTFSNTAGTFSTQIAVDALGNVLKEFWPDVHEKLRRKHPSPAQANP
jgi:hypothetical protein